MDFNELYNNLANYKGTVDTNDFKRQALKLMCFTLFFIGLVSGLGYGLYSFHVVTNLQLIIRFVGLLAVLFHANFIVLYMALCARRFNDADKSYFLALIALIPVIGPVATFIMGMTFKSLFGTDLDRSINKMLNSVIAGIDRDMAYSEEIRNNTTMLTEQDKRSNASDMLLSASTEADLYTLISQLSEGDTAHDFVFRRISKTFTFFVAAVFIYVSAWLIMKYTGAKMNPMNTLAVPLAGIAFLSYGIYKYDYLVLRSKFRKKQREIKRAFPLWMSLMEILIITNTIPNAIKKSYVSCPEVMKDDLDEFIRKLERNPVDKEAYKSFLSEYNLPEVSEIVMDMYSFNFLDKNKIVEEFFHMHDRLNRLKGDIRKQNQEQATFFIGALNSLPIFLVSVYILMVSMLMSSTISAT